MPRNICKKCGQRECEYFEPVGPDDEGYESPNCMYCNDKEIVHANERREWHYYHDD